MPRPKVEQLTPKQARFIKGMSKGMTKSDSAIYGGYSLTSAHSVASKLMKKGKILRALKDVGLSDKVLAEGIKKNIESGVGIKSTADTATKNIALALELKGYLDKSSQDSSGSGSLSQYNIYIRQLTNMTAHELEQKVRQLSKQLKEVKSKSSS